MRDAPAGSAYVVLTHDHALDFLIVAEALKRSQDGQGLILRVYESKGIRGTVKVDLCFDARQVHETNLMEVVEAPVALTGRSFAAPIAPFEIKTFLIRTST